MDHAHSNRVVAQGELQGDGVKSIFLESQDSKSVNKLNQLEQSVLFSWDHGFRT